MIVTAATIRPAIKFVLCCFSTNNAFDIYINSFDDLKGRPLLESKPEIFLKVCCNSFEFRYPDRDNPDTLLSSSRMILSFHGFLILIEFGRTSPSR